MDQYELGYMGVHTIRLTLQIGPYVGHIAYQTMGARRGTNIFETPFQSHVQKDIDGYSENDCNLKSDVDEAYVRYYTGTLTAADGRTQPFVCSEYEMDESIVAMEVIAYAERDWVPAKAGQKKECE